MSRAHTRIRTVLLSLFLVVAAASGGIGGASGTDDTTQATLTVTVVDQSGNPLGGAELSASWDGGDPVEATTASNGKAFVDVEEGADVTIRVDHDHYVRNQPYVVENASQEDVEIDVARKGKATVVVTDENGRIDNAFVRMFQDGQPVVNARTDANGEFTTDAIERDEYTLITFKEGYLRNKTTLKVNGNVEQQMSIAQDTVLVTFRVNDDHFDPPQSLTDANVTIPGIADVTTQGNGAVTVSVPVNNDYDVDVTKPGYGTVTRSLDVDESQTSLNVSIQRTPEITANTDNTRVVVGETVRVRITDEYGDAVPNASVSRGGDAIGETDSQGVITVPIESAGNHTISASAGGLDTAVVVEGVDPAADDTDTPTPTATPTSTQVTTTDSTGSIGPGFGILVSLAAVLALAVVLGRRRQ